LATYNRTEEVYVSGKGSWAKLIKPDDKWGKWSIQLHPNNDSLEKIRDLQARGLKNQLKKDDDGYFCNFSRPVSRVYKGVVKPFTPPIVVDKDGAPVLVPIGNGSDVAIKLEVYEHGTPGGGKAVAARLEKVRIDNLIPFNPNTDYSAEEKEKVEDIKVAPEALF
jgi:hypothetical protein